MLKAIKADLGYDIPFDNKNSGQTLSQLIAEKATLLPTSRITA
jgi:putative spermidine/putrescine transport system substrate-binding protein